MIQNNKKEKIEKMVTPVCRFSYPSVFVPSLPMGKTDEKEAKYSVTMLFDMTDPKVAEGVQKLAEFAKQAGIKAWGPDQTKWPVIKYPLFRRGDEPGKKNADGTWKPGFGPNVMFTKVSIRYIKKDGTKRAPPPVVDIHGQPIIDPGLFYGGCYGRVFLSANAYDNYMGNNGISFTLWSLRFERDGERFAMVHDAADDFEGIMAPAGSALPPAAAGAAPGAGFGF
jgi:hypothetical protein